MKIHDCLKLPKVEELELVRCVKVTMNNDESCIIKTDDLVGIQFVKDNKQIVVRRGRIKDIAVVNRRELSSTEDNVSRIVLDCSEQFTVKIIEIKFSDIIRIAGVDDEFKDYKDMIDRLPPGYMDDDKIPVREQGMVTKEEAKKSSGAMIGYPLMM